MSDMHVICAQAPRNLILKSVFSNAPVLNQSDFVNTVLFVIFLFNDDMRFEFAWGTVGGGGGGGYRSVVWQDNHWLVPTWWSLVIEHTR